MSSAARRSAVAALDAVRPEVARLELSRHPEDLAADLIESWSAVETALRALIGVSANSIAGQALIREARQREVIGFNEANALAEFLASRDRVQRTDYRPTQSDVDAARNGFLKLESSLMNSTAAPTPAASARSQAAAPETSPGTPAPSSERLPRVRQHWPVLAGVAAVIVIVVIVLGVALSRRGSGTLARAVREYQAGQRESAVADFNQAARQNPADPLPHIYLSRMAREVGNYPMAQQEAAAAVQANPNSELALREMGAYLLTVGNYDLARRFYIRAVQRDTTDRTALGYLGCSLAKLGRADEAQRWIARAGAGPWSGCASSAGAAAVGASGVPPA